MRRKKEEAEQTKQELLKAALAVFSERGYEATRLSDIADKANVTRGAIYWHFGNKENLFLELVKERVSPFFQLVKTTLNEEGTPLEKIQQLMHNVLNKMSTDREFQRKQKLESLNPCRLSEHKEIDAYIESQISEFTEQLTQIIKAGQKSGEIVIHQNPQDICFVLLAFLKGMTHIMMNHKDRKNLKERSSLFIEIFLGGISRNQS